MSEEKKPKPRKVYKRASGVARNGRNDKLAIESDYGPAMSSLSPLQQKFVEGLIDKPLLSRPKILREAGYDGDDAAGRQMCVRLMNNSNVLDAIQEVGRARLRGIVPDAVHSLQAVIRDKKHRDHVKATLALMDRTGLHAVTESKQTITHTFDRDTVIAKIAAIMERNAGLIPIAPPTEQPVVIEATITEKEAIETD